MSVIEKYRALGYIEAYDIARRVEVYGRDKRRYRLDVFRDVGGAGDPPQPNFSVRFYRETGFRLTPSTDEQLNHESKEGTFSVWVLLEGVPDAYGTDEEQALASGLKWLSGFIDKLVGTQKA